MPTTKREIFGYGVHGGPGEGTVALHRLSLLQSDRAVGGVEPKYFHERRLDGQDQGSCKNIP